MITNNNISYIDKIDYLCNVWENKDSGEINIKKLLYYLKNVFRKKSDYQKIYSFFTKSHKINYNLSKAKIKNLFINEQKIRYYFERNCQINYKIIDEQIEQLGNYSLPNSMILTPIRMINSNEKKMRLYDTGKCKEKEGTTSYSSHAN